MIPILRLFGGAALFTSDGQPVGGAAAQPRRLAVLALLADAWPAAVTRDRLIGILWPDQDEAGARRLLTQALYELRRELGPFVRSAGRDVTLDSDMLRVDLLEFREAIATGELERAVDCHRGIVLDGFHLRGSPEFERWSESLRDDTRRRLQQAVETLARREEDAGRLREAARWLEHLLSTSPFDAGLVLRAMSLLERSGNSGGALAIAATYERRIRGELELAPDPDVIAGVEELRARAAATAPVATSPAVAMPPKVIAEEATTSDARPPRSDSRRTRAVVGLLSLLVAAVVAVVAVRFVRRDRDSPARSLVVADFVVRGDGANPSLGGDVATVLAANLDGAAGFAIRRSRRGSIPGLGASGGAALSGDLIARGAQLTLEARLRQQNDSTVVATVTGSRDSVLALAQRLSIALLPALYPELERSPPLMSTTITRADALRSYLDGELALRRAMYAEAYAAFARATEVAPTVGVIWYRRAIAAEEDHRPDDADRSVAIAESLSTELPARERELIRGYGRWRAGDAREAEAIFRQLVRADSRDREAWTQLAEIAYHAGPLRGRPLSDAVDPWEKVIALDSNDLPALQHAIRLAARARDTAGVRALMDRANDRRLRGSETALAEARAIAAFGAGSADDRRTVERALDSMPDYSLGFLQGVVAGMLEQPSDARAIARHMIAESRPLAVRGQGRLAFAQLALAAGRRREASQQLELATATQRVAAAWYRAYFATLPFFPASAAMRADASRSLEAAPLTPSSAPLYLQLAVDASAAPVINGYLAELLRLGDSSRTTAATAIQCASAGTSPSIRSLCHDLQIGLEAERARGAGRFEDALRWLDSLEMRVPYQYAGRSMFFARTRERFLRAEMLEQIGRLREADDWYASVPHGAWMDYIYLAPTHLRRGRIHERLGDRTVAAEHYRMAVELWRDHDPDLADLYREAEDGLRRTTSTSEGVAP
jgi:DNA-binding SARP family transcriptional activator